MARAVVGEHRLGGAGNGQVVLGAPRRDHLGATLGQLGDHLAAEETGPSGHEDAPARPERRHGDDARPTRPSWGGARPRARRLHPRAVLARRPGRHGGRRACGSPSTWSATRRSSWSASPAGTAGHRSSRGGRRSRWPRCPLARPWLYESWLRFRWPPVERATGSRRRVPRHRARAGADTRAARRHRARPGVRARPRGVHPARGARDAPQPRAGQAPCRHRDLPEHGDDGRPRGGRDRIGPAAARAARGRRDGRRRAADVDRVRARHDLPAQFVLFVGTVEPRKNLERLAQAVARLDEPLPLVIAGADGWGGVAAALGRTSVDDALPRIRRRPTTCPACTRRRRCSPTPACGRASECRWPRRWCRGPR